MSVVIKVAFRVRPFTLDDELGVNMVQNGDEEGEVELLNNDKISGARARFPFTWSWWSAHNWKHHVAEKDKQACEDMVFTTQQMAYAQCGNKVKADVMGGNAVVLFAYGLSGSGKTYTVFGIDAADNPISWFKHKEPHDLWGIFPQLGYELLNMKADGWKFTMQYFQNVVDIVRDLMSPAGEERQYKEGFKKDADGFMNICWLMSKVITSWDELRNTFVKANARKAIAPTQFNPQSTRGHCVMTMEVEKPKEDDPSTKQRGRIYVCDLAGTEPAGDVFYAKYTKVKQPDGSIELLNPVPHEDQNRTKELQNQGKKINLSLSEMAQFFMKMAEGIKKKTLKPGKSIPGCNSYFLCKYLKDTMLQARTYLFCAIRPEKTYHKYTFATLGFGKNASVIKLSPKKAMGKASPAERKLMEELEKMKQMVEQLTKANAELGDGATGSGGGDPDQVAQLQAMLAEKQAALASVVEGGGAGDAAAAATARLEEEQEEYQQRGILLTALNEDSEVPHLTNLDEDPFRTHRFMYPFTKDLTVFGPSNDVQLASLTLEPNHCTVKKTDETCILMGGAGMDVYHNGVKLSLGEEKELKVNDRVAIANELTVFVWAGKEGGEMMSAEDAKDEFRTGMRAAQGGGGGDSAALAEQMRKFNEEKAEFEKQRKDGTYKGDNSQVAEFTKEQANRAMDNKLMEMAPKVREAQETVDLMNRKFLKLELILQRNPNATSSDAQVPEVMVKVINTETNEFMLLQSFEFVKNAGIMQDELLRLQRAVKNEKKYELDPINDPVSLLFDNSSILGTATVFLMDLSCMLETDAEERVNDIRNAVSPYNSVGKLEVIWTPIADPDNPEDGGDPPDWEGEEMLGKAWAYQLEIKSASGLPLMTDQCYCEYEFFGETFTTENVEQNTRNPVWNYKNVHHVPCVTEDFLSYLQEGSMFIHVYVNPFVDPPKDIISTESPGIKAKMAWLMSGKQGPCPDDGAPTYVPKSSITVNKLNFAKASAKVWGTVFQAMDGGNKNCTIEWADDLADAAVRQVLVEGIKAQLGCTVNETDTGATFEWGDL
jgi:hypothetical protein